MAGGFFPALVTPTVRLSAGYFTYCAVIGIFMPFWTPYLAVRGFNALEIGVLTALGNVVRSVGPVGYGWLADISRRPTEFMRLAAFLAVVSFALVPWQQSFTGMALVTVIFGLFWQSVLPLYEAHTLAHLGDAPLRYGRIRVWGSISFIVAASCGGVLFERTGFDDVDMVVLALLVATLLCTLVVKSMPLSRSVAPAASFVRVARSPGVLFALLVTMLVVASFGPYYTFFSLYLERLGYSSSAIGALWAVGVVAEIGVFAFGQRWLERHSIRTLFVIAAAGTVVRWFTVACFAEHSLALFLSQFLHCLGFGVFHIAVVLCARRLFPQDMQARAQALFTSTAYGMGGALGSVGGAVIWERISPQASYLAATFIVVLATFVAALGLRGGILNQRMAREAVT